MRTSRTRRSFPQTELGDAFGMTLMECWESGAEPCQVLELIERDDGYLEGNDASQYFAPPPLWGTLERWACEQASGRVLDIGAGAGRHALHLQESGFHVVALDVSPLAAEVCRRRGVREVAVGTVSEFHARGITGFDSMLMLGNNLGLLGDARYARRLLETLAAIASPGAMIIGQGMDPYATDNPLHLAYHERNRTRGRLPGQNRMRVRHKNLATPWFDYLFCSIGELEQILENSPWQLQRCEVEGAGYIAVLRHSP
jgi:SAM-dependent methyltransferase